MLDAKSSVISRRVTTESCSSVETYPFFRWFRSLGGTITGCLQDVGLFVYGIFIIFVLNKRCPRKGKSIDAKEDLRKEIQQRQY